MGAELQRKDIISDEALEAPLILSKNLEIAYESAMKLVKATKDYKPGGDDEGLASTTKKTQELTAEQAELLKVQKQIALVQARNNAEYIAATKALNENKQALKEKTQLGEKDAKQIDASNASMKELSAALIKNKQAYEQLASAEARASKEGQELHKVITSQDTQLKALKDSIGENQLSVGKYENATKNLKLELAKARDEMVGIAATLGADSEEFKEAAAKAGDLKNQLGDLNASVEAVSGSPIENLGGSLGLAGQKLKALDFKGATSALKQFGSTAKGVNFKSATAGAKQFGTEMLNMGLKLLKNPYVLLAIITIAIGAALIKLKDSIAFVSKAFDAMGAALGYVLKLGKDFLDWIGLTTFAADDKAKKIIEATDKEIDAIEKRYDREIKIAEAAGKDTLELETKKHKEIIAAAQKSQMALNGIYQRYGKFQNDEQKEQYEKNKDTIKDALADIEALTAGHIKSEADKQAEADKKAAAAAEKARLAREAANQKEKVDRLKLDQFYLELDAKRLENIVNNSQAETDARVQASEDLEKVRGEIAELELKQALEAADISASAQVLAFQKTQEKLTDIHKQGIEDRNKITAEVSGESTEQRNKRIAQEKETFQMLYNAEKDRLDARAELIKQDVIAGNKTKAQGDKELAELQKELSDDYIQLIIDETKRILEIKGLSVEEQSELNQKLLDLQKELTQAQYDTITEGEKKTSDKILEYWDKNGQKIFDAMNAVSELSAAFTAKRIAELDEQSEANKEKLDKDLEAEDKALKKRLQDRTLDDEQKKQLEEASDARKQAMEEVAAAREKEFAEKKRLAMRKQAILDKAMAIAQVAINTALAMVKTASQMGFPAAIPFMAFVGALGTAQSAVIATQPIPTAQKGIKGHKGGLILAGEAGEELVKMPGNRYALTDAVATVYDFPRGTDIIPHEETLKLLASDSLRISSARSQSSDGYGRLEKKLDRINSTIKNKREWNLVGRVTGYNDGGTRARYIESLRNRPN